MAGGCRSVAAVCMALLFIGLVGCGRKTDLVLPQSLVPVAIKDLRYGLDENGVTLQWSYPRKMESGDEIAEIDSFEVFRAAMPAGDYCEGCPVRFDGPIVIDGAVLPESGRKKIASYAEGGLQVGYRYIYKVRSRAQWWYPSRDSNPVSFVWLSPPPPVEDLQIKVGDRAITLKWQPVDRAADGSILAEEPVYQIYRSLDNDKYDPLDQPVADNSFADVRVENSKRYFYRVRTLRRTGDMLQGGALSDIVSGVPGDLTPPAPVQHLVAVRVPGGIKLAWQAVPDVDLAGYRIYRWDQDAQEPDLIGEVESSQNQFIDRQPVAAKRWYYSVSSFDTASPANESSPSMEAFMQQQ